MYNNIKLKIIENTTSTINIILKKFLILFIKPLLLGKSSIQIFIGLYEKI